MRMYAGSQQKNVALLLDYAQRLRVKPKILTYLEILLWLPATPCNWKHESRTCQPKRICQPKSFCRITWWNVCAIKVD